MLKEAKAHVTRVRALDQLHRGDEIEARLSRGPELRRRRDPPRQRPGDSPRNRRRLDHGPPHRHAQGDQYGRMQRLAGRLRRLAARHRLDNQDFLAGALPFPGPGDAGPPHRSRKYSRSGGAHRSRPAAAGKHRVVPGHGVQQPPHSHRPVGGRSQDGLPAGERLEDAREDHADRGPPAPRRLHACHGRRRAPRTGHDGGPHAQHVRQVRRHFREVSHLRRRWRRPRRRAFRSTPLPVPRRIHAGSVAEHGVVFGLRQPGVEALPAWRRRRPCGARRAFRPAGCVRRRPSAGPPRPCPHAGDGSASRSRSPPAAPPRSIPSSRRRRRCGTRRGGSARKGGRRRRHPPRSCGRTGRIPGWDRA